MKLNSTIELFANRKLHKRIDFRGLKISIENRKGSVRRGVSDGKPWQTTMTADYGYIRKTTGMDAPDLVDCFVGPSKDADKVYIVHSKNPKTNKFDEDKCVLGVDSVEEAKQLFMDNYDDPRFFGGMSVLSFEEFKDKVLGTKNNPQMIRGRE